MRLAIVTRADKNIEYYSQYTHPIIKQYADFCNADFIKFDHDPPVLSEDGYPHFRIMKLGDLLNDYDRALCIDSDVVINKNCPNIFNHVPENSIGTVVEDQGSIQEERRELIKKAQEKFGDIGWKDEYINTGVFVVSKMHKDIFNPIEGKYWDGDCSDDVHLGYQIHKCGFKIHKLPYQFNHMSIFSQSWNGNANPLNSYIIHFAGSQKHKLSQVVNTIRKIYG